MVIVDSSVWIDAINGVPTLEASWLHRRMDREPIGLTSLILCEVLQGMRSERRLRAVKENLLALRIFETYDRSLSMQAAENYRVLRSKGITIRSTIDCLIATFCIANRFRLLHRDSDFTHFVTHFDLEVVDATSDAID